MPPSTKQCKRCDHEKLRTEFVSQFGFSNTRGRLCRDCWTSQQKDEAVNLMDGRDFCLYCGTVIPRARDHDENGRVIKTYLHMDHMDPVALGGYDPYAYDLDIGGFTTNTTRNVVYCCAACNIKKNDMPFKEWLELIPKENQELARRVYIEKNGVAPEDFVCQDDVVITISFGDDDTPQVKY